MRNDEEDEDDETIKSQFKIILLGDGTVGKSSIALRFSEDQFTKNYKQTVGCDFFIRRIDIPPKHQVTLQIWDIGGQSIGSKMISKYIAGSHAILFCYDITNYESFANLEDWHRIVFNTLRDNSVPNDERPYLALIGNKNDLRHMQAVNVTQHNKFSDENEMRSFLMSAKNGDQVVQTFWRIANTLAKIPPPTTVDDKSKSKSSTTSSTPQPIIKVIPAQIIDHKQHDENVADGKLPEYTKSTGCFIS